MVQKRGGWLKTSHTSLKKTNSHPTPYVNTAISLSLFVSASSHPATESVYKEHQQQLYDRQ